MIAGPKTIVVSITSSAVITLGGGGTSSKLSRETADYLGLRLDGGKFSGGRRRRKRRRRRSLGGLELKANADVVYHGLNFSLGSSTYLAGTISFVLIACRGRVFNLVMSPRDVREVRRPEADNE